MSQNIYMIKRKKQKLNYKNKMTLKITFNDLEKDLEFLYLGSKVN